MIVVVALVVLWASYKLANHLRFKLEGAERGHPGRSSTVITETPRSFGGAVSWSALDDHQLTRLLTQSASRNPTHKPDEVDS